jgi:hypothetical protein
VRRLQGHQVLALNRGEKEGKLKVGVEIDRELALQILRRRTVVPGSAAMEFVKAAAQDAWDRLLFPSLEREIRADLTAKADEGAIHVFSLNLRQLLLQPPIKGKVAMGLDPGYRMGCKVAVVDATGKVLDTAVIYPTCRRAAEAKRTVLELMLKNTAWKSSPSATAPRAARRSFWRPSSPRRGGRGLHDRQRGRRVASTPPASWRRRGIPGVRREPAQRGVHRPPPAGPPGGAGEDRPRPSAWASTSTTCRKAPQPRPFPAWWRTASTPWAWT